MATSARKTKPEISRKIDPTALLCCIAIIISLGVFTSVLQRFKDSRADTAQPDSLVTPPIDVNSFSNDFNKLRLSKNSRPLDPSGSLNLVARELAIRYAKTGKTISQKSFKTILIKNKYITSEINPAAWYVVAELYPNETVLDVLRVWIKDPEYKELYGKNFAAFGSAVQEFNMDETGASRTFFAIALAGPPPSDINKDEAAFVVGGIYEAPATSPVIRAPILAPYDTVGLPPDTSIEQRTVETEIPRKEECHYETDHYTGLRKVCE